MTIEDIVNSDDVFSAESLQNDCIIKVVGVGGGGNNAVQHMYKQGIEGVSFVILNTDMQQLANSSVPSKLLIGKTGRGAGNKPEVARKAAEESAEDIKQLYLDGTQMVFITAGMGGGTGTGAAPVVARIARECGMLTIGIVTIPFAFEGQKKILKALAGADEMSKYVDALLVINNERLTEIYPDLMFMNAFGKADDTLTTAAKGISELITNNDHVINIDFNDVDTTLRDGGAAIISIGYGEGEGRVTKAIEDALNSPLLKDRDIYSSKRILFNIYFNPDAQHEFVMREAEELTKFISNIDPSVDVIWGLAKDPTLGDKVKITLLAAGFSIGAETSQPVTLQPTEIPLTFGGVAADKPDDEVITVTTPADNDEAQINRLNALYGEKTQDLVRQQGQKKQIVFKPEQLDDDSMIERFEQSPTYTRDLRTVEEIKKAPKKAEAPEVAAEPKEKSDDKSNTIHLEF